MDKLVYFLIPVGLAATLIVLGLGIYSLAKGGTFAKQHSNKLMRLRVLAQGVTIALMLLFLFLIGRGPGS
ncbi:MAG: twin transmembrane helix small protein [Parvularculaceae bacterium]|nr:twin transmembrane helix small protein [Parvularculaceae bacterium]